MFGKYWTNFDIFLWEFFPYCKWQNIEQIIWTSGHTEIVFKDHTAVKSRSQNPETLVKSNTKIDENLSEEKAPFDSSKRGRQYYAIFMPSNSQKVF